MAATPLVHSSRPRRGDAAILRAQTILCERLRQPGVALGNPSAVRELLRLKLADKPHEVFVALWLDTQNRLIFPEDLFRGTLTQTSVHPREVVKSALAHNAAGVILAHNHPSGDTTPSRADIELTAALMAALRLVDVRVLDHFIVSGAADPISLAERGLLTDNAQTNFGKEAKDATSEPQPIEHDFKFTASLPLYAVSKDASADDIRNQLAARLSQLGAMLTVICGAGAETFDSWSTEIKDDYLWGCSMIAHECKELAGLL